MAADQYCLKWNNHQSTLLVQFETLLESDSLTDCTLSAEGKYLNVHKVLLSACSPYFSKLLGEHKDKHPIFFMKDVAFEELKGIVEYMYKGEVNVMQERLDSFLKTASSLQIKGLADQDGGKGEDREEDPGGGRIKRKTAPDLRGGYGESSPMPEEPPRSPKRRRRPRPVSQDDSLPAQDQNHCDTTTAPAFSQLQQQEVVMPTPLVPVKKTEPVDNSMVHLKTEIPDDVPQVDVQDLTLDDDEDFNNEDITQPGTSFSETSQDFAQWQQQMATQSGPADESFMAATQGINQSGSQDAEFLGFWFVNVTPTCIVKGEDGVHISVESKDEDDESDINEREANPIKTFLVDENGILGPLGANFKGFGARPKPSVQEQTGSHHHQCPASDEHDKGVVCTCSVTAQPQQRSLQDGGGNVSVKREVDDAINEQDDGNPAGGGMTGGTVTEPVPSTSSSRKAVVGVTDFDHSYHLVSSNEKMYVCDVCNFKCKGIKAFTQHRNRDCKTNSCPFCSYTSKRYSNLRKHVKSIHNKNLNKSMYGTSKDNSPAPPDNQVVPDRRPLISLVNLKKLVAMKAQGNNEAMPSSSSVDSNEVASPSHEEDELPSTRCMQHTNRMAASCNVDPGEVASPNHLQEVRSTHCVRHADPMPPYNLEPSQLAPLSPLEVAPSTPSQDDQDILPVSSLNSSLAFNNRDYDDDDIFTNDEEIPIDSLISSDEDEMIVVINNTGRVVAADVHSRRIPLDLFNCRNLAAFLRSFERRLPGLSTLAYEEEYTIPNDEEIPLDWMSSDEGDVSNNNSPARNDADDEPTPREVVRSTNARQARGGDTAKVFVCTLCGSRLRSIYWMLLHRRVCRLDQ